MQISQPIQRRIWAHVIVLILAIPLGCHRFLLESDGFRDVRVGESFSTVAHHSWKTFERQDTLFVEEGYYWRGVIWETGQGPVVVEESFFGDSTINRIRVESSKFRTPRGIRVGDSVAGLKGLANDWVLTPIPAYDRLDLYSYALGGYHFLVQLPEDIYESQPEIRQLADSLPILGIVVM